MLFRCDSCGETVAAMRVPEDWQIGTRYVQKVPGEPPEYRGLSHRCNVCNQSNKPWCSWKGAPPPRAAGEQRGDRLQPVPPLDPRPGSLFEK